VAQAALQPEQDILDQLWLARELLRAVYFVSRKVGSWRGQRTCAWVWCARTCSGRPNTGARARPRSMAGDLMDDPPGPL